MVCTSLDPSTSSRSAASIAILRLPSIARTTLIESASSVKSAASGLYLRNLLSFCLRDGYRQKTGLVLVRIRIPPQNHEGHVGARLQKPFGSSEIVDISDIDFLVARDDPSDDRTARETRVLGNAVRIDRRHQHTVRRVEAQLSNHIRRNRLNANPEASRLGFSLIVVVRIPVPRGFRKDFGTVDNRDRDAFLVPIAIDFYADRFSHWSISHNLQEHTAAGDLRAIDLGNHVASTDASLSGGTPSGDILNNDAAIGL